MNSLFKSKLFITISIVTLAVVFSELLVHFQMVFFWEDRKHDMGYYLGFWTPLIDAVFVVFAVLFLRSFYEKELQTKNQELEENNEMFSYLLDTTMEGIVILDENNQILLTNQVCVDLLKGDSKEEFIGRNIVEFVPDYEVSKLVEAMKIEYESPSRYDLKKQDGVVFPTLLSSRDIIYQNQKARFCIILDLTQIKQQEKQLFEQSKMVSMGEMIGNIAHQWRQPLTTISTKATGSIFQKEIGELSDEVFVQNMEIINDNVQYLSQTIDTFRNFIKGTNEKEKVAVCNLFDEAINLIESSLKNNYIELHNTINCEADCGRTVLVPSHEFTQVIINILNNAKDAIVERKIENPWIKIDHSFDEANVIITIEDNAGGIAEGNIDKVFDPYFTTKHESVGTGLGLHMSYRIITESIGGKLYVRNSENGAKFFIEIPLS